MRMVDLINKKRNKELLSEEEINFIINGYCHSDIPDYQISAWLMAICFNGLSTEELYFLTKAMVNSGKIIDLSKINGIIVDKHSTGGVGDKVSIVLIPLVASCGLKVAKMSGRGLGHTGGTLDKLESIDGFNISLNYQQFINQINDINAAIIGQTDDLVIADKKLYALRDVTGTVECKELIAASIMSKKIAAGANAIVLDVKYGNGAFMKTIDDAIELGEMMITIGERFNKKTKVIISSMNQPLGITIGNKLEIIESIKLLNGEGETDLLEVCLSVGAQMLCLGGIAKTKQEATLLMKESIDSKKALSKFKEIVLAQGGNLDSLLANLNYNTAKYQINVYAKTSGYIKGIDSKSLGTATMLLGGGRKVKEDSIDYNVGLVLNYKVGDKVNQNDVLTIVNSNNLDIDEIINLVEDSFVIIDQKVEKESVIEMVI